MFASTKLKLHLRLLSLSITNNLRTKLRLRGNPLVFVKASWLPNVRDDFAAHVEGSGLFVRHNAFVRGNDSHT